MRREKDFFLTNSKQLHKQRVMSVCLPLARRVWRWCIFLGVEARWCVTVLVGGVGFLGLESWSCFTFRSLSWLLACEGRWWCVSPAGGATFFAAYCRGDVRGFGCWIPEPWLVVMGWLFLAGFKIALVVRYPGGEPWNALCRQDGTHLCSGLWSTTMALDDWSSMAAWWLLGVASFFRLSLHIIGLVLPDLAIAFGSEVRTLGFLSASPLTAVKLLGVTVIRSPVLEDGKWRRDSCLIMSVFHLYQGHILVPVAGHLIFFW